MTIKFLKKGIRVDGEYMPVWYSKQENGSILIYAQYYRSRFPAELHPVNNTDSQTDYFEKDRAVIGIDSPYYSQVEKVIKQKSKWGISI